MRRRSAAILFLVFIVAAWFPACRGGSGAAPLWTLTPEQYLDSPAVSVLVFHDTYPEGKQGGVEIIQHGDRVAADGDVRLEATPGQWAALPSAGPREADPSTLEVRVRAEFVRPRLAYSIRVRPEGESVRISVDLEKELDPELAGKAGFNLELFPPAYFGKAFYLGETAGVFPRQGNGPMEDAAGGPPRPVALARGPRLVAAPEDSLRMMTIESLGAELELFDGRDTSDNGWFVVRSALAADRTRGAAEWVVTPRRVPGWRRAPMIGISQVGYHPGQVKRAVIELDRRSGPPGRAMLLRVSPDGGLREVLSAPAVPWEGKFLRYDYAGFDFTPVREPGMYVVRYGASETPPFRIAPDVYRDGVWQPTLETYLPVQMCHVEVRDGFRIWHGACHLDDAVQAPPDTVHFDGYRQSASLPDRFAAHEHIPFLARGGWHDAGDYDLAAGSQAETTRMLVLIGEAFGIAGDQTTVDEARRSVVLHRPDGVPDLVQQIGHGAENLLSGYRVAGHSFGGIIAGSIDQYVLIGDTASMTDNLVYDPALGPGEVRGGRSGRPDDRWAFTDPDTSLEYKVAAALASAIRNLPAAIAAVLVLLTLSLAAPLRPATALDGANPALAGECLETALGVWEREQARTPIVGRAAYVPGRPDVQEVMAAVELFVATGQDRFRDRIVSRLPVIEKNFGDLGWTVSRVLAAIGDPAFAGAVRASAERYAAETEQDLASNPYGVPWHPRIWGLGWNIQSFAVGQYYLVKGFPDLFEPEPLYRALNYVLGCHPGSNVSFVSGVGARSLTIGYGMNRADWSYIPGMNVSGTALIRPDFPELKDDFPFLWQQAENVIGGAATYIFAVLAADDLLKGGR